MAIVFNPYFTFEGNAREALDFYAEVFGGDLNVASFKDFGAPVPEEHQDLVMHGELTSEHLILRVSDGAALSEGANNATTNMEAALIGSPEDLATAQEWFTKLEAGASNVQPLTTAPWGATFGSLTDKFGIAWMFNFGG